VERTSAGGERPVTALAPTRELRVSVRNLSKTFPGTTALQGVDLDVRAGEIHALVGGNGSGKSTLVKILTGVYQGDPGGELQVGDIVTAADRSTPELARDAGVHVVHQDLGIFPDLSVLENMALGHRYPTGVGSRVRWSELRERTRKLIERFEIDAEPSTLLSSLSHATRTQIAIARALQDEDDATARGVLILDEPTSALPAHEVDLLLGMLRRYAAKGQAILYVSHRLDEVLDLADRITVLRDGSRVGTFPAADMDEDRLIEVIVGRQVDRVFPPMPEVTDETVVLETRRLCAGPVRDVDLRISRGEVVGIAGLLGSGRTELLRAIFGDLPIDSGEILVEGRHVKPRSTRDAMEAGVAYVPENRAADGAFLDLPVHANLMMASVSQYWSGGRMADRRMRAEARRLMAEFLVKAPSEDVPLSTLSGGNQQKVVLARWLRRGPRLLLLDEPTQGVDVGARAEIYALVRRAVAGGASAIVVASDFEELAHVCDRALILQAGRVTGEIARPHLTAERLTQMAYHRGGE
jgi:ribose transport system ATP-binding protein